MRAPDAKLDTAVLPWRCSGIELDYPARLTGPQARLGYTPFAFWLMGALRPRIVVDLGVSTGAIYCALLQAARNLGLETRCFGIDAVSTDKASEQSGETSHDELRAYHDPLYGTFSTLIRSSFDDARPLFSDGSIDLLEFEGFETHKCLTQAFASWLPKMSSRGVALFHDTNWRRRGFDVWRFWEDIARRYPSFEFIHSRGLGVAYVGSDPTPSAIQGLFDAAGAEDVSGVREYFARLGMSVVERFESRLANTGPAHRANNAGGSPTEDLLGGSTNDDEGQDTKAVASHPLLEDDVRIRTLRRQMVLTARLQRELAEANQEKERYARKVEEIYASQSWRISAPLRFIVTKLRGR